MYTIGDFEVVDHGIEQELFFVGLGVAFTPYTNVATGCGDNFAEAVDDCLELIAQADFETEGMEKRILRQIGRKRMPRRPKVRVDQPETHYYVSIRWREGGQQ